MSLQIAAAFIVLRELRKKRAKQSVKRRAKRKIWVQEWIAKRNEQGAYRQLMKDLKEGNRECYKNFLRMDVIEFGHLLTLISSKIKKKDTPMRKAITPGERLAVTLRYLATGDSYKSLMYLFRIPEITIARIIPECCNAIYDCLQAEYLKVPRSEEEWEHIAYNYETKWNFPHCLGALDGKHIVIKAPPKSGNHYYNYKGQHSIVLMALVDADYKFTYVDIGCNGRISDRGVFGNCSLSAALETNTLNIPEAHPLKRRNKPSPFVIVADDAFPLKSYLMKPYPFRQVGMEVSTCVYNYRLSRARRVGENAFGLISQRFRVLRRPIELIDSARVTSVVKAHMCVT